MILIEYELDSGFIVPMTVLEHRLRRISLGNHQWLALAVPKPITNGMGRQCNYVAVGYTNPEMVDMPNFLCYLFPILDNGVSVGLQPEKLICLHPSAAIPIAEGWYFEDALLKRDILEDWGRFWDPLKQALVTS